MLSYFQDKSAGEEIADSISPIIEKLNGWKDTLLEMTPNIIVALITLVIFYFVGRGLKQVINRHLVRFTNNKSATNILANLIFAIVFMVGFMISLSFLKLDEALTGFLAGAGIVGIALGFAFQETAANFISGTFMAFKSNFRVGDYIETNDVQAVVEHVDLRSTKLKTLDGLQVIIPNKDIFQSTLINYNRYPTRRIDLQCGVAYDSNLDQVERATIEALKTIDGINATPSPQFFYTDFGDSSINYTLRFWIDFLTVPDFFEAKHAAIKAIKKRYDKDGITIPFPMRTVEFNTPLHVDNNKTKEQD